MSPDAGCPRRTGHGALSGINNPGSPLPPETVPSGFPGPGCNERCGASVSRRRDLRDAMRSYTRGWGGGLRNQGNRRRDYSCSRSHTRRRLGSQGVARARSRPTPSLHGARTRTRRIGFQIDVHFFSYAYLASGKFITVAVSTARVRLAWRLGPLGQCRATCSNLLAVPSGVLCTEKGRDVASSRYDY